MMAARMRASGIMLTSKIRQSLRVLAGSSRADSTACHFSGGSGGTRTNMPVTVCQPGRRPDCQRRVLPSSRWEPSSSEWRGVPDHAAASLRATGRPPCSSARSTGRLRQFRPSTRRRPAPLCTGLWTGCARYAPDPVLSRVRVCGCDTGSNMQAMLTCGKTLHRHSSKISRAHPPNSRGADMTEPRHRGEFGYRGSSSLGPRKSGRVGNRGRPRRRMARRTARARSARERLSRATMATIPATSRRTASQA